MVSTYEVVQASPFSTMRDTFKGHAEHNGAQYLYRLYSCKKRQEAIDWVTERVTYPTEEDSRKCPSTARAEGVAFLILRVEGNLRSHILTRSKGSKWPPQVESKKIKALSSTEKQIW